MNHKTSKVGIDEKGSIIVSLSEHIPGESATNSLATFCSLLDFRLVSVQCRKGERGLDENQASALLFCEARWSVCGEVDLGERRDRRERPWEGGEIVDGL